MKVEGSPPTTTHPPTFAGQVRRPPPIRKLRKKRRAPHQFLLCWVCDNATAVNPGLAVWGIRTPAALSSELPEYGNCVGRGAAPSTSPPTAVGASMVGWVMSRAANFRNERRRNISGAVRRGGAPRGRLAPLMPTPSLRLDPCGAYRNSTSSALRGPASTDVVEEAVGARPEIFTQWRQKTLIIAIIEISESLL